MKANISPFNAAALTLMVLIAAAYGGTPSLVSIGVVDPANPESGINAISSDGQFAVGYSTAPNSDQTRVIRHPMFWSTQTGIVKLPNPAPLGPGSDIDGEARGVVYRPLHPSKALGISGAIGTTPEAPGPTTTVLQAMHLYWGTLANPASGTWFIGDEGNKMTEIGAFNTARMQSASASSQEGWYIVGHRQSATGTSMNRAYRLRVDPIGLADWYALYMEDCVNRRKDTTNCCPTITYEMANSVDGAGRGIGYDNGNSNCGAQHRALWFPTINWFGTVIPGGAGILSQGLGISYDGQVVSGFDASAIEGSAPTASRAFIWRTLPEALRDPEMRLLNNLPGDVLGSAIAVTTFETTGGYSSDGTTERAVIWDKSGMWDNTGEPKLLSALLAAQGVDVSAWTSLSRVTSFSDNGQTAAGWGVWAADGSKRGFIAKSGNAVGACCLRSGLGTGTCLSTTPDGCAVKGGQYLGDDAACGAGNANCNFCGKPWADTNFDNDVDMDDFGLFQTCFGVLPVTVQCGCLDKGSSSPGAIAQDDFQKFLNCATGPNVPYVADPTCEP